MSAWMRTSSCFGPAPSHWSHKGLPSKSLICILRPEERLHYVRSCVSEDFRNYEFWSLYTIFGILLENFTHTDEKFNCFFMIYLNSTESRIVDPDDLKEACFEPAVPQRQHIRYKYKEPKAILRKRRRRRQTADACVPSDSTDFCTSTLKHRQAVVDELWTLMSKNKHIYHEPESEVEDALKGCLLACGTCLEGTYSRVVFITILSLPYCYSCFEVLLLHISYKHINSLHFCCVQIHVIIE